ncbi:glycerophosphodiester phosphodiesterase [Georgenia sp. EYE_87]|uniref:glycerophosphodiester phosphodiesterase family protein n=1 Tax=Georgenia sp. EYE_87 TaxID=2853448 RepID=UPI002006A606|nr:glycerophosphodiester phosphodiesterase family protein [Georgenia sp. EYE_87]MCK6211325.1 glycerophosphodiester phosphodiesterase [Georgenia sp. EYE_87]
MATLAAAPRPARTAPPLAPGRHAPRPAGSYGSHPGPWAFAHRGGMELAPENTLAAFDRAVGLGLTYLETDVRTTADGVPLAFHDRTLDRVTGLRGPVAARTWAEISRTRVLGTEPVLRLEDLLAAFPDACVTIDVKEERAVVPTIEAIRRTGSAARVCVAGGWDPWLAAIRRACGAALTTALGWRALTALIVAARTGVRASSGVATGSFAHVSLRYGRVPVLADPRTTGRLVQMAADLGLGVVAWTVNDVPTIRRLADAGVAGIITDRPDVLRETLAAHANRA